MVVYIYFERLFAIRAAVKVSPTFMSQIDLLLCRKIEGTAIM